MRSLTRTLVLAAAAVLAVPAMASAAPGAKRGVVVQRDARAGALVVATKTGSLLRVKLAKPNSIAMGSLVRVSGARISVVGHARSAKVRGVVVRRSRHSVALAGNGSVLAVASTSPPTTGQLVSTTVQVSSTELTDDDGQVQVEGDQVPGAEIRGTVLSVVGTTLRLTVPNFPAGLPIAIGTYALPSTLAVGTPVEARVTLGPDPANAANIVLTLVSLHVENGQQGDHQHGDHQHGSWVKAEGKVSALTDATATAPGSVTVDDADHGPVTFVILAGFGPLGVILGEFVDAKGTPGATATDKPTLVRLESSGDDSGDGGHTTTSGDSGSQSDDSATND
jgi:hypothetical protein